MEKLQKLKGTRDWGKWKQLKTQLNKAYKKEEEFWSKKSRGTEIQNTFMP